MRSNDKQKPRDGGPGLRRWEWGTPYRPKRGGDTLLRDSAYLANKFAKLREVPSNKNPCCGEFKPSFQPSALTPGGFALFGRSYRLGLLIQ